MVTSSMTLCVTLVMLSPPVVHNSVPRDEITCSNVSCDRNRLTSENCPLWHFCNPRTAQCSPCGSCRDAEDNAEYRNAPPKCRDPTYCVTNYDFLPEHVCPRLRVKEGCQCSGNCVPCQGTLGHFLGTVCRFKCADGDSEILACIFLNEEAQWNITRKPLWLAMEKTPPLPPVPSRSEDVTPDEFVRSEAVHAPSTSSPKWVDVHSNSKLEFSTVVLVSAMIFVVVVATVVGVVAAIYLRHKRAKSHLTTRIITDIGGNIQEEQRAASIDAASGDDRTPDNNNNSLPEQQTPRGNNEPVEVSDHFDILDSAEQERLVADLQVRRNAPVENSDTHCSMQSTFETEKSPRNNSYCFDGLSRRGSELDLRSERGDSPPMQRRHPNHPLVNNYNHSNTTYKNKADNRRFIPYHPLNVGDETSIKYVQ